MAFVLDSGEISISGHSFPVVPYLIFDMADGDVRKHLSATETMDYAWRFRSLHDLAVGLKQLHQVEVSHQDLKPSNILVFSKESKIGDLGRSMCRGVDGPYNRMDFSGDRTYAPPEILYGYYERDWTKRVCATDCYLLGSMIVFYFAGISMTALLRTHMHDGFGWDEWTGEYDEIVPYLDESFSNALDEFEQNIMKKEYSEKLRSAVEQLCTPYPDKRGHPYNISARGSNYSMERYVSLFDYLRKKAEYQLKRI